MKKVFLNAVLTVALAATAAWAESPHTAFSVDFANCTEFAGVGPVTFAKAASLVPSLFTTFPTSTSGPATGGIVVRATSCAGVKINGGFSVPTAISQIGVEIVSPDGTGTINNYTVIYESNNLELVEAFNLAGVPAVYAPSLTYQFTYTSATSGTLYAGVDGFGIPAYFLFGTASDPAPNTGADFKANWWYDRSGSIVKQASDFPNISFGNANVTVYTDKSSVLGQLIGGNSDSDFHFLPVRGVYATAHMDVTVSGH
jgi:hypothetical protein